MPEDQPRATVAQPIAAERELLRTRLQHASAAAAHRAAHLTEQEVDELIERARNEVHQQESAA